MTNGTNDKKRQARLTDKERGEMLREFMLHVDAHPVSAPRTRSPYIWLMRSPIAYALALFVVLGGTVYAADGSLPADPLYPLKTDVIEPIAVQLAPLAGVSRGDAHVAIVERRLDEAETLLASGDLATSSASLLARKIAESSSAARTYVSRAAKDGNVAEALDTSTDLESILEGHSEVLSDAADDQASSTSAGALVDAVKEQGDQAEDTSEDIEDELATSSAQADDYIHTLKSAATSTIATLQDRLAAAGGDDDLVTQASSLLSQAFSFYEEGVDDLARGDNDGALSNLRDAESAAEKGLIILDSIDSPEEE